MIVLHGWEDMRGKLIRPVVALGKFDGVHRGHQKLLAEVRRLALSRHVSSMAMTFDVHPYSLLKPNRVPPMVTTPEEKMELISQSKVDALLYLNFTPEFAHLSAWEFARDYLAGIIGAGMILAGKNFRFGRNRTGGVEKLRRWGKKLDFEFLVVLPTMMAGEPISSTRVRKVVTSGDMPQAARLLGRPDSLAGEVYQGEGRGRGLGAPTANLRLPAKLRPPDGVYLVRAAQGRGRPSPALANLGYSPTFGGKERRLEVHFLGRREKMYGKMVKVFFERFLRPEISFTSPEALAEQIQADLRQAEKYFRGRK